MTPTQNCRPPSPCRGPSSRRPGMRTSWNAPLRLLCWRQRRSVPPRTPQRMYFERCSCRRRRAHKGPEEEGPAAKAGEDDSELFQAALRASRVDLGPRGISQAAKIMATGDEKLGQQALAKPKCASRQSSRGFKPDDSPGGSSPASARSASSPASAMLPKRAGASAALRDTGKALARK
ncbi:unnamed protein product [Effrenium voratum]|uniref:Uncharacterized protein n=1 Tax=Effrenium voratum TaxID=2562239 RepID=A0AA36N3A5_9DINO|nr:unnamed protein product [Effrenium voratum]